MDLIVDVTTEVCAGVWLNAQLMGKAVLTSSKWIFSYRGTSVELGTHRSGTTSFYGCSPVAQDLTTQERQYVSMLTTLLSAPLTTPNSFPID